MGAFLGWIAVVWPLFARPELLIFAIIIGLPIAFGVSWIVAAPHLRRVMRNPVSWLHAALTGARIAFTIALIAIAIARFLGWLESHNPNRWSQIGGGEYVQEVDGILTAYGWLLLAQNTVLFTLSGGIIGLFLRALIGPGRR